MTADQADLLFNLILALGMIGLFAAGYLCGSRR